MKLSTIKQNSVTQILCNRCKKLKDLKNFQRGRANTPDEYVFEYCNECRKIQKNNNINSDIDKFLSDKYQRLKRESNKNSIIFSISKEEFINQYKLQDGLCFYTDVKMAWKAGRGKEPNSLSIDKIIPANGYVAGNFVFCADRINSCKSDLSLQELEKWFPIWYKRIINSKIIFQVEFGNF